MIRFVFEARAPHVVTGQDGRPFGVQAGNVRTVEVYEIRDAPHRDYLGSLTMTSDSHAALIAELAGAAVARAMHAPCHGSDAPPESCTVMPHPLSPHPVCCECRKPWPCPTVEVLPSW